MGEGEGGEAGVGGDEVGFDVGMGGGEWRRVGMGFEERW